MIGSTPGRHSGTATQDQQAPESLADLLGGRRAAFDASIPPAVFTIAWLAGGHSVAWGAGGAVAAAAAIAGWRWYRGDRPRAVLLGLLGVVVAALIVLRTGRAADFFLVQIATNIASALAWTVSIVWRWPLLGLVVGGVLRQRTSWRRDPALLRAYGHGSWVWVAQYLVRIAVLVPLWATGQVVALGVARLVLSWPLVTACLVASWWVVRRSLPPDHPGLRHPRVS
jgi:Protein of unknown function (DUF3159)